VIVAVVAAARSLGSAWNPGYYYLTRAAVFALIGAGASNLLVKERGGRHGLTVALLYVTVLLGIVLAVESVTAPPNQIESVDIWYWPLALLFLIAAVISAVTTMLKGSSVPGEPSGWRKTSKGPRC
jgi:peptidoglycan/LPS O-acetylase OafA/YrhL